MKKGVYKILKSTQKEVYKISLYTSRDVFRKIFTSFKKIYTYIYRTKYAILINRNSVLSIYTLLPITHHTNKLYI